MAIKAIETEYNGYRFRSRLEARWAVFFDALGVKYEYEPDGYETEYGKYLPDFRVKCYGKRGACNTPKVKDESNLCYSCKYGHEDSYAYQHQCTNPDWTVEAAEIDSDNNGQCCACELYELDRSVPFDLYIEVKGRMTEHDAKRIKSFASANKLLVVGNIPPEGCSYDSMEIDAYCGMDGTDILPFNYELIDGDNFAAYPAAKNGRFYLWGDDGNYIDASDIDSVEAAYRAARQARFEHGETPVITHG